MDLWQNSPKTVGASTHTFKNYGCWSTHSTHTNEDPDLVIQFVCFQILSALSFKFFSQKMINTKLIPKLKTVQKIFKYVATCSLRYVTFPLLYTITISKSKLRESKKQLLLESVTAPSASELASANSEKKSSKQRKTKNFIAWKLKTIIDDIVIWREKLEDKNNSKLFLRISKWWLLDIMGAHAIYVIQQLLIKIKIPWKRGLTILIHLVSNFWESIIDY